MTFLVAGESCPSLTLTLWIAEQTLIASPQLRPNLWCHVHGLSPNYLPALNFITTPIITRNMQGMFGASVSESLINIERTVDLCVITKKMKKIHMRTQELL